jgi:Spy/CpxP family protein refolding chaperone
MPAAVRGALLLALLVALPAPTSAQGAPPVESAIQEDPLFATLYPPELIMQHRRAIELDDEQRDAISQLIQDLQGRVLRLQWELLDEVQELARLTALDRVDLDSAVDQMNRVLDRERDIKQAHLEMLVRIKNLLTPAQQARLDELRRDPPGTQEPSAG